MRKMIHTPEGVRDIYNGECARKKQLTQRLLEVIHTYGYEDIETPTFEYFDVFGREIGTTPSKDLYKFFDKEGNTLVLRPDFTPSIVRAASMYLMDNEEPVRLTYEGSTFQNSSSFKGRLRESTEIGVEFFNDPSAAADAEVLALLISLLQEAGLHEFQVSVGEVEFFKALVEESNMPEDAVYDLRALISSKNYFGVEELIREQAMDPALKTVFLQLPELFGGIDTLQKARTLTDNEKAQHAIDRLSSIYQILSYYGCENYVSFDLGMLSKYRYYTGIIFQAYTYGTGEAILKGGRYDNLMSYFGKSAPAVGFSMTLASLMNVLDRQNLEEPVREEPTCISYQEQDLEAAVRKACAMRRQGKHVKLCREEPV